MTITVFRPTWVVTLDNIHGGTQMITVTSVHFKEHDAQNACVRHSVGGHSAAYIEVWYRPDSRTPLPGDKLALIRDGNDPVALAPPDVP